MSEITKLHKRRGTVKAKLTRLQVRIGQINEDQISREEIEVYLARLEDIWNDFQNVQSEIIIADGEFTVADSTEEADFEEKYFELKVRLKRWFNSLSVQQAEARSSTSDKTLAHALQQQSELMKQISLQGSNSQATSSNNDAIAKLLEQQTQILRGIADASGISNQESKVKLPMVKLPTFDGKTEEWKRFSETFQSMIHANESIPNIQKFQYLVTSLSGNAAKIIESIELTDANYAIAWELLKKRFDDPRAIKKKHIQCLFTMPKVEKESAIAIRSLVDYTLKHLRVLKSLNLPTDSWGELIIHMMESRLDTTTLRAWEQNGNTVNSTLENLTDFLEKRCQIIERIEARSKEKNVTRKGEIDKAKTKAHGHERTTTLANSTDAGKCYLCQGEHFMYQCEKFLSLSIDDRIKEVRRLKLCLNCLRNDHFVKTCKMGSCRECAGRHNTLCHRPTTDKDQGDKSSTEQTVRNSGEKTSSNIAVHHAANPARKHVLMATAIVNATHQNGSIVPLRILLDSASEAHFITHSACNKLGVKRNRASEIITGISEIESDVKQCCEVVIKSKYSGVSANIRGFIVPRITKMLPCTEIDCNALKIPTNIKLADPEFYKRSSIDMLIGAEFFFDWIESGKIELGDNRPILINTKLGWIIAGSYACDLVTNLSCNAISVLACSLEHCETLNRNLNRFWELESYRPDDKQFLSVETRECEELFEKTTTRDENGRFIVRLPFSEDSKALGESREIASKRLLQLERRFKRDKMLHERYIAFMRDYIQCGHMSLITESDKSDRQVVYLPHHGVIKESSSSTKLRAVFDASNKTSSGKSLNDILRVGPAIQGNLIEIIMRFRLYNVALTGDIKQMYRQILIHPDDRDYQRILWRFSAEEPIKEFRLNTVTYGEASSAYLAIRCIHKLAEEAKHEFPIASRILLEQTYVDDMLAGADNPENAALLQEQLTMILKSGGFEAHKWCSSHKETLAEIPPHLREDTSNRSLEANDAIKTLGLEWNPNDDQFRFFVHETEVATTKRGILSAISKFFDPLGLIGPILTTAKIIMQRTWQIKCQWDEPLPASLVEKWEQFRRELSNTETLCIPRRVIACNKVARIYLQGFCDASESAYGACVYIQAEDSDGTRSSKLLCSKSRVAPIQPTSIPRLELCSAVLLAHLIINVQRALTIRINDVKAWTDSQVVLWWIRGDPSRWKPFVANRVNEIIELVAANHWNHVRGAENPADMLSRGATLQKLKNSELWWSGPLWLQEESVLNIEKLENFEPTSEVARTIQAEERKPKQICILTNNESSILQELINKHSSITRIERVLAYCIRFMRNIRKTPRERELSNLSVAELQEAHLYLIRHVQANEFADEIASLRKNRELKASSKILQLRPFLDEHDVLRVGGRLQHSI